MKGSEDLGVIISRDLGMCWWSSWRNDTKWVVRS